MASNSGNGGPCKRPAQSSHGNSNDRKMLPSSSQPPTRPKHPDVDSTSTSPLSGGRPSSELRVPGLQRHLARQPGKKRMNINIRKPSLRLKESLRQLLLKKHPKGLNVLHAEEIFNSTFPELEGLEPRIYGFDSMEDLLRKDFQGFVKVQKRPNLNEKLVKGVVRNPGGKAGTKRGRVSGTSAGLTIASASSTSTERPAGTSSTTAGNNAPLEIKEKLTEKPPASKNVYVPLVIDYGHKSPSECPPIVIQPAGTVANPSAVSQSQSLQRTNTENSLCLSTAAAAGVQTPNTTAQAVAFIPNSSTWLSSSSYSRVRIPGVGQHSAGSAGIGYGTHPPGICLTGGSVTANTLMNLTVPIPSAMGNQRLDLASTSSQKSGSGLGIRVGELEPPAQGVLVVNHYYYPNTPREAGLENGRTGHVREYSMPEAQSQPSSSSSRYDERRNDQSRDSWREERRPRPRRPSRIRSTEFYKESQGSRLRRRSRPEDKRRALELQMEFTNLQENSDWRMLNPFVLHINGLPENIRWEKFQRVFPKAIHGVYEPVKDPNSPFYGAYYCNMQFEEPRHAREAFRDAINFVNTSDRINDSIRPDVHVGFGKFIHGT